MFSICWRGGCPFCAAAAGSATTAAQTRTGGKKVGYPGLTAGVAVDPATGDVYMVVWDQGLWKSVDGGEVVCAGGR